MLSPGPRSEDLSRWENPVTETALSGKHRLQIQDATKLLDRAIYLATTYKMIWRGLLLLQ